jgi:hypothetical protein
MTANHLHAGNDAHMLSAVIEVVGTETWHVERVLRASDTVAQAFFQNKTTSMH